MTPTGSQTSSLMISQGAGSSMQRTPQKSVALPISSQSAQASHASSMTPTKIPTNIPESLLTPHSREHNEDQVRNFDSFCK